MKIVYEDKEKGLSTRFSCTVYFIKSGSRSGSTTLVVGNPLGHQIIRYFLMIFVLSWRAGPATKMIDSTGRLPKEGMLSDYFSIVGQVRRLDS